MEQSGFMNQMTPTEQAYIAGIVDGEGCITMRRCVEKHKDVVMHRLFLYVSNTDLPLLLCPTIELTTCGAL